MRERERESNQAFWSYYESVGFSNYDVGL